MRSSTCRGLALVVVAASCLGCASDLAEADGCGVEGQVESCECNGGASGVRTCEAGMTWSECRCLDAGEEDAGPVQTVGVPGTSGGSGAPADGSDAAAPPAPTDGGEALPVDASGDGTGGSGGSGGNASPPDPPAMEDAGAANPPPPATDVYGPCTEAGCEDGAVCRSYTTPSGLVSLDVCAPPCPAADRCPDAMGAVRAVCEEGYCRLDCSRGQNSCPTGMRCVTTPAPESFSTCLWP